MTRGWGGWCLDLLCVTCGHREAFRGVVWGLAVDFAVRAGWVIPERTAKVSTLAPGERDETCPACSPVLAG